MAMLERLERAKVNIWFTLSGLQGVARQPPSHFNIIRKNCPHIFTRHSQSLAVPNLTDCSQIAPWMAGE